MVQATLDPDVLAIDYQAITTADGRAVPADGIIVERLDGRYAVDLMDARPASDPAAETLLQVAFERKCAGMLQVSAADIRKKLRFSSAREVWRYRTVHVHGDDRAQVVEVLESEGSLNFTRLDELVSTRGETRAVIYALACEGSVELELRVGLADDAVVRAGRFACSAPLRAYGT